MRYCIGDQLFVQPDPRLAECFPENEPVRMTRQEVAVARSHIEAWKAIANGDNDHVLILEDDIWFKTRAATRIERGWRAALGRCATDDGPHLLYLSYSDAGGTTERAEPCADLFRPKRGLWFLSGYVLSRKGAAALLRAMPVVGPVDLWMNYRFAELEALALASPVIAQRRDAPSDNAYSVLPYLARAGVVDAECGTKPPNVAGVGPVLAWSSGGDHEGLPMALSVLGLRVRVFDGDEDPIEMLGLGAMLEEFDALVDAPLSPATVAAVAIDDRFTIVVEEDAAPSASVQHLRSLGDRVFTIPCGGDVNGSWRGLCDLLGLVPPAEHLPTGALRSERLFRADRGAMEGVRREEDRLTATPADDSPWVLPPSSGWRPSMAAARVVEQVDPPVAEADLTSASALFVGSVETFPGNLATFGLANIEHGDEGARLVIEAATNGDRPYRSGAIASIEAFAYGRFEAEIRAASGSGLITGFFLHRDSPRQEIDIEFAGGDPRTMLTNVYFNPGDEGTSMSYGYRGSPCRVDLGFDATKDFHRYAIDWRPGRVAWLVDGEVVHERLGWDPTPIPHLRMRLHANLWAPRSRELAGRLAAGTLPAAASFKNLSASG